MVVPLAPPLAGAMAAAAANMTLPALLRHYLLDKLGMNASYWNDSSGSGMTDPNPHLASKMVTTGVDYEKVLQAMLSFSVVPRAIQHELERDAYEVFPGLQPANDPYDMSMLQSGHYSMGAFLDCFLRPWDNRCAKANIHYDPGSRGFTPVLHRGKQYYMLLVVDRGLPNILPEVLDKIAPTSASKQYIQAHESTARCIAPLRFALMRAIERTLGLWQGPEHEPQLGDLPYPQNEICAVGS